MPRSSVAPAALRRSASQSAVLEGSTLQRELGRELLIKGINGSQDFYFECEQLGEQVTKRPHQGRNMKTRTLLKALRDGSRNQPAEARKTNPVTAAGSKGGDCQEITSSEYSM
ncbi:hypothetical protein [Radicibacter daui]|uniref:hypothetical protein n=1 Tax=Radicibacter daui TaxID=3064829 RepID=UPI004046DAC4